MKRRIDDSEVDTLEVNGQSEKEDKKGDFLEAVSSNDVETVGYYLDDPDIDPADENNQALRSASEEGHTQMVRLLLTDPRVHPMQEIESLDDNDDVEDPLILASQYGHVDIVKVLLADERVDPGEYNNQALQNAIITGFTEVVELLLKDPRVDPTKGDLLFNAVQEGNVKIVKLLLSDCRIRLALSLNNLSENEDSSLSTLCNIAAQNDNLDALELLLSHSIDAVNLEVAEPKPEYTQIKVAMNCNKFGLFNESIKKAESKLGQLTAKNLGEEIGNAYNNAMKK
jgi:ankyrin repeat protein